MLPVIPLELQGKRINCFLWHSHEQQAVWCYRRYLLCRRFRRFSLWRKAGRGIGFGCIIKWFMSSFVPERDKQLPQTWGLPTGKLKWKALPLPCGGDETATFYDSVVFSVGSVIVCGFFISTARWKYSLFLLLSHRRNPRLRHFAGCSFGTSRNK